MVKRSSEPTTSDWINLRILVISLGEVHNWWASKVLTESGEEFLEYVLPKTKQSAAHQLALEIGRTEHDKQVGPGRYHLFRLPQKWEEKIFGELRTVVAGYKMASSSEMMSQLHESSAGISIASSNGPVLIGSGTELGDWSVFQSFAQHYFEAFEKGYKTYPYLN